MHDILHQSRAQKVPTFRGVLGQKLSTSFLHWNLECSKMRRMSLIRTLLDSQARYSPKQLTWFLVPRSRSETYLCWNIPLKICFSFVKWNSDGLEMPKHAIILVLTSLDFQTHFFQLYLLHFPSRFQSKAFHLSFVVHF